jgi:hypothetical protein
MTTGIRHCNEYGFSIMVDQGDAESAIEGQTFMMRSGRNVPTPAMPMPDFAVPYAAPIAIHIPCQSLNGNRRSIGTRASYIRRPWRQRCQPMWPVSIRIDGASSDIRGAAGTGHHSYHPNKRGELGSEFRLHGGRDGDGLRAMEEWLSEC